MKWCRFKSGDQVFYGIIEGDIVTEVSGSPFGSYTKTSNTHPLRSVKLEVPLLLSKPRESTIGTTSP